MDIDDGIIDCTLPVPFNPTSGLVVASTSSIDSFQHRRQVEEVLGRNIFPTLPDDNFYKRRGRPVKLNVSRGGSRGIDMGGRGRGISMGGRGISDDNENSETDSDEEYILSDTDEDEDKLDYEGLVNEDNLDQDTGVHSENAHEENNNVESDENDLSDASTDNEKDKLDESEYECDIDGLLGHQNRRRKWKDPFEGMYDNPFNDPSDGNITFVEGQTFGDVNIFRGALRDYAVNGGYLLNRIKNDPKRVTAICNGEDCQWRIHASILQDGKTFMVKTLYDVHACVRPTNNKNSNARTKWIAEKVQQFLPGDTNASYDTMQATLTKVWGVEVPIWQMYKARNIIRYGNQGSHAESYKQLHKWIVDVQKYNPDTVIKLEYQPREDFNQPPQFKSIFVCFEAMRKGFLEGCRPFIGLDGCHLKGPYGGCLLAAVSMDANKGIFPLAIAIVENESYMSWEFFLDSLKQCIDRGTEDKHFTFMSDRQKGLIEAVKNLFPNADHRYCAMHIWMNFKQKFPGSGLKKEFWSAVKATSGFQFWAVMRSMKDKLEGKPYEWLMKIPVSQWSRHAYSPDSKSEHTTNNMTETFNAWILKIRGRPIIQLLEAYRQKCMIRVHKRHAKGCQMEGKLVPKAKKTINETIKSARLCTLVPGRNGEFEIKDGKAKYFVNLEKQICNCQWWKISGMPCKHAILCIGYKRGKIEEYVSNCFTVDAYMRTYDEGIHPVPDAGIDIDNPLQVILPPPLKRMPGRPRISRRRQAGEEAASNIRKRSYTVRCSICKMPGHNKIRCQRDTNDPRAPRQATSDNERGRGRGRGQRSEIRRGANNENTNLFYSQPAPTASQPATSTRGAMRYSQPMRRSGLSSGRMGRRGESYIGSSNGGASDLGRSDI